MLPRDLGTAWLLLAPLGGPTTAGAADDLLHYDFEAGPDLARYGRITIDRGVDAQIVSRGG